MVVVLLFGEFVNQLTIFVIEFYPIFALFCTILLIIFAYLNYSRNKKEDNFKNEKYVYFFKKTTDLTPEDFAIVKYNPYYHITPSFTQIHRAVNNREDIIIVGSPGSGKTRASYEVISTIENFNVVKFKQRLIKVEEIPDKIFQNDLIIFFDDLNKYVGKIDLQELVNRIKQHNIEYFIIANCRTGSEFDKVRKKFEKDILSFNEFTLGDIDEDIAETIAGNAGVNFDYTEFDGSIGSIFSGLHVMKIRYDSIREECKVLIRLLKLLYNYGVFNCEINVLNKIYNYKIKEEDIFHSLGFYTVIEKLIDYSLIINKENFIEIKNERYLDFLGDYSSKNEIDSIQQVLVNTGDAYDLFYIGNTFSLIGDYETARSYFVESLKISEFPEALKSYAATLVHLYYFDDALKIYEKIDLEDMIAKDLNNKGVAFSSLNRFNEAIGCYDAALELEPTYYESWTNKGLDLVSTGYLNEAIGCYDAALELKSDYVDAWIYKGIALKEKGHFDAALECYDAALELEPNSVETWNNKGIVFKEIGRFDAALECYGAALDLEPNSAEIWKNKGLAYEDLNEVNNALDAFERSITLNPDSDAKKAKKHLLRKLRR